jgi:hypothetical protein
MKWFKSLLGGVAALALLGGGILWWFTRDELSTRVVCTNGQVCTEYFSVKDGLPVRSTCPSEGGEKYPLSVDCIRVGSSCSCR